MFFQWSDDSSAFIWKFLMQIKQLPPHGSVHFRRRINIDYGTTSLDGTDALTTEDIFLSIASSNIKSEFRGQLQLKSTYLRTPIFVSLAMLGHHVKFLILKNRA